MATSLSLAAAEPAWAGALRSYVAGHGMLTADEAGAPSPSFSVQCVGVFPRGVTDLPCAHP